MITNIIGGEKGRLAYYEGLRCFNDEQMVEAFQEVKDINGNDLQFMINQTMMRVNLPQVLKSGDKYSFKIKWWYNINDHVNGRGRSGYEYFAEDAVVAEAETRGKKRSVTVGWTVRWKLSLFHFQTSINFFVFLRVAILSHTYI